MRRSCQQCWPSEKILDHIDAHENLVRQRKEKLKEEQERQEKTFIFVASNKIELLCNGDPMGDELSLTFILRTRWFSTKKVLTLKYRLEEGDSKK